MADDHLVSMALEKIAYHDAESAKLKQWVNMGDKIAGNEPRFPEVEAGAVACNGGGMPIAPRASKAYGPGTFFNKPFAGAVKTILADRFEAAGKKPTPASVDEILEALTQGSFSFETSGADSQKNSIRISLGKNSVTFVKLPNSDLFGLVEWYGGRAPRRRVRLQVNDANIDDGDTDTSAEADGDLNGGAAPSADASGAEAEAARLWRRI
jgi:hypothetical protein